MSDETRGNPVVSVPKRRQRRLVFGLLTVLLLAVVGWFAVPWVYINFVKDDPPPKLSFDQRDRATTVAP